MDLTEYIFVSLGESDPWGPIINPLWAAHLTDMKKAWDNAASSVLFPLSRRSPLRTYLLALRRRRRRRTCLFLPSYFLRRLLLVAPLLQESLETVIVETLPGDLRSPGGGGALEEGVAVSIDIAPL